jgi:DNA invertase Pin-like site-specific DNA recombinase
VIEQGIDMSTAQGRAMLGMLSVLAELQREPVVANTATASPQPSPGAATAAADRS